MRQSESETYPSLDELSIRQRRIEPVQAGNAEVSIDSRGKVICFVSHEFLTKKGCNETEAGLIAKKRADSVPQTKNE